MTDDTDPFGSGAFGATKKVAQQRNWNETNDFQFPERTIDLFGLFLDADIRYARQQALNDIENNTVGIGNQPMTQGTQLVQKTMLTLQAINIQAQRNHSQRSVQR
jgi:hypothetical protein